MKAIQLPLTALIFAMIALHAFHAKSADADPQSDTPKNKAVIPEPRADKMKRFESINERAKKGDVDLLFIGDSITENWMGRGKDVWSKYYGHRKAMNMGIGGDRTQHVLWRMDHGNIDGINPKLAVLMIGTNNAHSNNAEEIAAGIKAILDRLQDKLPQTKVLLLGIFPRGEHDNPERQIVIKASELASKFADNKRVFYLDIGSKFLEPDGSISKEIMPDFTHPSEKGYEIWAEAIEPKVAELLGDKPIQ
ncbi:MAG TPA: platelet-activating factor acetylhydrolase IB subunit [Pirellulales bacterium]|jgi:beta-glucosidase